MFARQSFKNTGFITDIGLGFDKFNNLNDHHTDIINIININFVNKDNGAISTIFLYN